MAIIAKHNLQYTDYSWTALRGDDPRMTGTPDSTLLNRYEGYEVLAFLNRHCSTLAIALKAERMIRNVLPSWQRSHSHVVQWLNANWQLYA